MGVQSHGEAEAFLQVDEKWRESGAHRGEFRPAGAQLQNKRKICLQYKLAAALPGISHAGSVLLSEK